LGIKPNTIGEAIQTADMKAAEKFASLHNELLKLNPDRENDIGELICRLLLCCFANSIGSLASNGIQSIVSNYTDVSGSEMDAFINNLFAAMKSTERENLPGYFSNVNFIDERLFGSDIAEFVYNKTIRSLIVELLSIDWSEVSLEMLISRLLPPL